MHLQLPVRRWALVIVLSLPMACKSDPAPQHEPASAPKAQHGNPSGHAAANVTPGSHDDWCEEHQVPESMCTRCNPSLVAAFKATGDWCEEHGLPESQCRLCNPNLKLERPPKKERTP